MDNKIVLHEQFIIQDKFPTSVSKADLSEIKNVIFQSLADDKWESKDFYAYQKYYLNLPYNVNINWVTDYVRDHYGAMYKRTPVIKEIRGIVQKKDQMIASHKHMYDYDLHNSTDISCILTLGQGDKVNEVIFDYEGGRKRHMKYSIPLTANKLIIFNSELIHYYTENLNESPNVYLSLTFELI